MAVSEPHFVQPALSASPTEPFGLRPSGNDQGHGRARQFANLLDSIVNHETENQRWLRLAAARLEEQADG